MKCRALTNNFFAFLSNYQTFTSKKQIAIKMQIHQGAELCVQTEVIRGTDQKVEGNS